MEGKGVNRRDDNGGGGTSKRFGDIRSISSSLGGGLSWPPRSYTCSFCKREFRSAQALGGHMNVHRRDRARLRQWPPWDIKSSNPNPNFSPSTTATGRAPQFAYPFPSLLSSSVACFSSSSSSSSSSSGELKMSGSIASFVNPLVPKENNSKGTQVLAGLAKLKGGFMENQKEGMFVALDLDIGLCRDSKEDLDLELRLGYV